MTAFGDALLDFGIKPSVGCREDFMHSDTERWRPRGLKQ
jgi:hypothetical protein